MAQKVAGECNQTTNSAVPVPAIWRHGIVIRKDLRSSNSKIQFEKQQRPIIRPIESADKAIALGIDIN